MDQLDVPKLQQLRDEYWHPLCHRSEVGEPGHFVRLTWLGDDVVAYNDAGSVLVFDNVCPHRGARFFMEASGNTPLVCRYHGWCYRNGALRISRKDEFDSRDIEQADISKLHFAWCGDLLFASIRPRWDLARQLTGVFEIIADTSMAISSRFDFNSYIYECDWRTAVENALEPYHINLIHSDTLASLRLEAGRNDLFASSSVWYSKIQDARTDRLLKGMNRLFALGRQFEGYMSIYLFPFSMLSSTYGFSHSLQNFFPGHQPGITNFYSRLLISRCREGVAADALQGFFESTAAFNRRVFDEDHQMCKRVHPRIWEMNRPMPLSRSEEKVAHFRGLLRDEVTNPMRATDA